MRLLCTVNVPVHAGNRTIQDGSMGQIIGTFLETWKPEGAYFGVQDGNRTAYFILDVKDLSQLPAMFEPVFQQLEAKITYSPVMSASELQAGIAALK